MIFMAGRSIFIGILALNPALASTFVSKLLFGYALEAFVLVLLMLLFLSILKRLSFERDCVSLDALLGIGLVGVYLALMTLSFFPSYSIKHIWTSSFSLCEGTD